MTYAEKANEAERLLAAGGTPDAADYPILSASVGVEADNLASVAAALDRLAAIHPGAEEPSPESGAA